MPNVISPPSHELAELDTFADGEESRDQCWRIAELATALAWHHDRKAGDQ